MANVRSRQVVRPATTPLLPRLARIQAINARNIGTSRDAVPGQTAREVQFFVGQRLVIQIPHSPTCHRRVAQ